MAQRQSLFDKLVKLAAYYELNSGLNKQAQTTLERILDQMYQRAGNVPPPPANEALGTYRDALRNLEEQIDRYMVTNPAATGDRAHDREFFRRLDEMQAKRRALMQLIDQSRPPAESSFEEAAGMSPAQMLKFYQNELGIIDKQIQDYIDTHPLFPQSPQGRREFFQNLDEMQARKRHIQQQIDKYQQMVGPSPKYGPEPPPKPAPRPAAQPAPKSEPKAEEKAEEKKPTPSQKPSGERPTPPRQPTQKAESQPARTGGGYYYESATGGPVGNLMAAIKNRRLQRGRPILVEGPFVRRRYR